jgi:hypothetical protein
MRTIVSLRVEGVNEENKELICRLCHGIVFGLGGNKILLLKFFCSHACVIRQR